MMDATQIALEQRVAEQHRHQRLNGLIDLPFVRA